MKTLKNIAGILMLLLFFIVTSCGSKSKKEVKSTEGLQVSRIEVSITGMSCTGCEQTIKTNVAKIEGVKEVNATFTTGKAIVDFYPSLADTSEIRTAIVASGYGVTGFNPVIPADSTIN
jgi:copper chaperone CopZ